MGASACASFPLEGTRIAIDITDDGAGVDLPAVRAAALRAGFITTEQARQLSDTAVLELIYRSGLSTSPIITNISGRGLGLAIVREQVERLGGHMRLDTQAGTGTTIHVNLPASITTLTGLLVHAGDGQFLLPLDAVERAIRVDRSSLRSVQGREVVTSDGQPWTLAPLAGLLGMPGGPEPASGVTNLSCVLLREDSARLALAVDEIAGIHDVVVKQFERPLVRIRCVASAGLLGSGQLALILRPADLVRSAEQGLVATGETDETRRPPFILVVNDSITTRTMEKNLLESAGYQVRVAADGVEGWTILQTEEIDLVVSDVDMPRMDGFELTSRIRTDQKLAELPVVLVTALESRANKERGIAVGANAYVVKSSFEQSNLLEIIHRLV